MKHCQTCGQATEHHVIGKYAPSGEDVLQCQSCNCIAVPYFSPINIILIQSDFTVQDALVKMQSPRKISIDPRHDHYWIENEVLHESYHTIRGLRWRELLKVPGMSDDNNCSLDCLNYITKNYLD